MIQGSNSAVESVPNLVQDVFYNQASKAEMFCIITITSLKWQMTIKLNLAVPWDLSEC